ncbi:MAG: 30S ribosomal protein S6 [Phycisphaerae bacterium]
MADSSPRPYEGMFLFGVEQTVDVDAAVNRVKQVIERFGGEIIVCKKWDERRLAYEIQKQRRGLYVISFFRGTPDIVAKITREVNLSDDMLRLLILDAEHLTEEEMHAVEPQKPERDRLVAEEADSRTGAGVRRREEPEEAPDVETADVE